MTAQVSTEPPTRSEHGSEREDEEGIPLQTAVMMWADGVIHLGAMARVLEGKLLVASHEQLPAGEEIYISFPMPESGKTIRLVGHVEESRDDIGDDDVKRPGMLVRVEPLDS